MLDELRKDLHSLASEEKAKLVSRFFKTGKGEYGEGDVFIGVVVPDTRKVAIKYTDMSLKDVDELVKSKIHEERLCALLILVNRFEKYSEQRKEIYEFYVNNIRFVNNWDLVDTSAHKIVGRYIFEFGKKNPVLVSKLFKMSESENIWERRIAIISTAYFIGNKRFDETLALAELLMGDKHDLMHKAVGWMLREVGKKDVGVLEKFLKKHYKKMPRTMLRYAIEKFSEKKRKAYLEGKM